MFKFKLPSNNSFCLLQIKHLYLNKHDNLVQFTTTLNYPSPNTHSELNTIPMGDYFDEMGWEPVPLEETQRHQNLLVIRELIANGLIRDDLAFDLPPPAARAVVENLKERTPAPTDECCTICLKPNDAPPLVEVNQDTAPEDGKFIVLPCSHEFHKTCIMPWLNKVRLRRWKRRSSAMPS